MKATLQVYIESDIAEKVVAQADKEKRSLSNLIGIMIEEGLEKRDNTELAGRDAFQAADGVA